MTSSTLSVQLYTVRDHVAADLPQTLERLARIGFTRVEPYDFVARADELARSLTEHGLTAPTAHAPLLSTDQDAVLTAAKRLGIETVIDPYIPAEFWQDAASVRETAEKLNAAAKKAAVYGIRVGYHNHDWEISSRIEGVTALEYLAAHLDPEVVLEVDTYWAAVGGEDVLALLQRLGGRVVALHVKDGPRSKNNKEQVAVGSGSMPVDEIIAATDGLLHVVELDDFNGEIFDAVADSHAYLTK
ncbi:sugar phosphate isomerase/epimerase family protein [Zhihengliuella halotolerans]|uniref:sugar phosphate isomerase/epimerase family protein n=1 Tax=Zhihengliuella halotolerans TaxID=370736 RepID=UPI000C7FB42F|nr:sugar phosphate isomerase/epimerase [Zhihengliuella halotolerans]